MKLAVPEREHWKKREASRSYQFEIDGTELEGLLPTIGYIPIEIGIEQIANLLINKLGS